MDSELGVHAVVDQAAGGWHSTATGHAVLQCEHVILRANCSRVGRITAGAGLSLQSQCRVRHRVCAHSLEGSPAGRAQVPLGAYQFWGAWLGVGGKSKNCRRPPVVTEMQRGVWY